MTNNNSRRAHLDPIDLKRRAAGQWGVILSTLGGLSLSVTSNPNHQPCPKCGGTDRFRVFADFEQTGGCHCNQCFSKDNQNGVSTLAWLLGVKPIEAIRRLAEYFGGAVHNSPPVLPPTRSFSPPVSGSDSPPAKPPRSTSIEFKPWSDAAAAIFCARKKGIAPAALTLAGARLGKFFAHSIIALPAYGEHLTAAPPVNYIAYDHLARATLPGAKDPKTGVFQKIKVKVMDKGAGWIGEAGKLAAARSSKTPHMVFKTEGPSDLLALLSHMPSLPFNAIAITNLFGASENPRRHAWLLAPIKHHHFIAIADRDEVGLRGANHWAAAALQGGAVSARVVILPWRESEVGEGYKDLRDWFIAGHTIEEFLSLVESTPHLTLENAAKDGNAVIAAAPTGKPSESSAPTTPTSQPTKTLRTFKDPHGLAETYLQQRIASSPTGIHGLKYWRSTWYQYSGKRYEAIDRKEFTARVSYFLSKLSLKEATERRALDAQAKAHPITPSITNSVVQALESLCVVGEKSCSLFHEIVKHRGQCVFSTPRNWIALQNGILDVDAYLDTDPNDHAAQLTALLPHSPAWFSTTCLPFDFNPTAECHKFESVIHFNLSEDIEKINLAQQWLGYLLTPDLTQQKFLCCLGDGGNGKSVYAAVVQAALGAANCSMVAFEDFGDKFSLEPTIGKLVNISTDAGAPDRIAEGRLKAFVAGDPMDIDRKYLPKLNVSPTARLMVVANEIPRFSDKSDAIWRRVIPLTFDRQIKESSRIVGMDKAAWWVKSGEMPGVFNWALEGLRRYRIDGRLPMPEASKLFKETMKRDSQPELEFLESHYHQDLEQQVSKSDVYSQYRAWCEKNGYQALSNGRFGRAVFRVFPLTETGREPYGERKWTYQGIALGEKIPGEISF